CVCWLQRTNRIDKAGDGFGTDLRHSSESTPALRECESSTADRNDLGKVEAERDQQSNIMENIGKPEDPELPLTRAEATVLAELRRREEGASTPRLADAYRRVLELAR